MSESNHRTKGERAEEMRARPNLGASQKIMSLD